MKKFWMAVIVIVALFSLVGCGNETSNNEGENEISDTNIEQTVDNENINGTVSENGSGNENGEGDENVNGTGDGPHYIIVEPIINGGSYNNAS